MLYYMGRPEMDFIPRRGANGGQRKQLFFPRRLQQRLGRGVSQMNLVQRVRRFLMRDAIYMPRAVLPADQALLQAIRSRKFSTDMVPSSNRMSYQINRARCGNHCTAMCTEFHV
jgi:hypothetical protein